MQDSGRVEQSGPLYVVGVGASAGGLEALERLFHSLPANTGLAFVVVQHLSPDFESVMDELLVRQTDIPVRIVVNGMPVESNAIYLIPPRKEMIISGGRLLLTDKDPKQALTLPIDVFFRSLAQDIGPRSVGVVLSGTGSDGSRGIRDIHNAGGLVIAQSEETARFDGMPRSAIATGVVDLVLSPELIAQSLVTYAKHPIVGDLAAAANAPPVDEHGMNKLMRLLRDAYGIDFTVYKPNTVVRRIERRVLLNNAVDFEQYVEDVAEDPEELNSLYRDLLIGVTQFFRDRDAFAVLKQQVLPELLEKLTAHDELRVWCAGCATGEEAYSLAILIQEQLSHLNKPVSVKVFATDVHRASLDLASVGAYEPSSLSEVSPDRLHRFFTHKGDHYQIAPELRQMVVFAQHNIVKDAPFTRLDLISCRNLLIYLQPPAQRKAVSLFHFGLKTGGVLFLGPSENMGNLEDEFSPIDRHWKIYRKRRDVRLATDLRLPLVAAAAPKRLARTPPGAGPAAAAESDLLVAYDQLLERFMPPAILINDRREVVHVFGHGSRHLQFRPGRPTSDFLDYLEPELRTAVSGAIHRAIKEGKPIYYTGVEVAPEHDSSYVRLGVIPVISRHADSPYALITIEDLPRVQPLETSPEAINIGEVSRERIAALERELRNSKESLQAMIEELETSNEELHATNEELVASNEELQSTNEELHSVNEELFTVNAEYQRKISELTELTDDMRNLLESTDVGVLFLDRDLCIRKFTPRIARSFNILERDLGRPFDNFTHQIIYPQLMDAVRNVLATGLPFEREVRDRFQAWHFLRILPYRTQTEVEGVVVTLIDIGSLKSAEADLRKKDRELKGILDNSPAFIFVKDLEGRYQLTSQGTPRVLGVQADEALGKTDYDFLPQQVAQRLEAETREVARSGQSCEVEETLHLGQRPSVFLLTLYALRDDMDRVFAVAGIWTDITRRKRAERRARKAVEYRDRFLATLSHELRNPLAAVQSATRLLDRLTADQTATRAVREASGNSAVAGADMNKACDVLKRQVEQMRRLLDDLLDISRVTRGKIELHREVFDLRHAAEDALTAARSLAARRDLMLRVTLPDEPLYVCGDATRLQQIQVNLLVNAVKYTPPGGTIDFQMVHQNEQAVITVRDTGMGIPSHLLHRIFEPFLQAHEAAAHSDGGMGLGLTLVRSLVELHGGKVAVASEGPGKGSEFRVWLPLSSPPTNDREPGEAATDGAADPSELRLVLVEDNADARDMLRLLLESYDYRVATADDGRAGLAAIETHRPDVAILDIGLPELNGYEVARRVRERFGPNGPYLIALTGFGQASDRRRARESGFDEHLTKPVNIDELRSVLQSAATRLRRPL